MPMTSICGSRKVPRPQPCGAGWARLGRPLAVPSSCRKGIKLNTSELVERLAAEHGVSKDHTRKIIDSVLAIITDAANAGEEVKLAGFGRFKVADRAARTGRNPATGETTGVRSREQPAGGGKGRSPRRVNRLPPRTARWR